MTTITTFTGVEFSPLSPRLEDIDIRDIAHGLSNLCRFSGQCPRFYSVAEHSVLVSRLTPPEYALGALLHDASEAYGLNDVAGPIKPFFPDYVKAEDRLQGLVYLKWTISGDEYMTAIKSADKQALVYEQEHLFKKNYCSLIQEDTPKLAKYEFLCRFTELTESAPEKGRPRVVVLPQVQSPSSCSNTYESLDLPQPNSLVGQHSTAEVLEERDRRYNRETQERLVDWGLMYPGRPSGR